MKRFPGNGRWVLLGVAALFLTLATTGAVQADYWAERQRQLYLQRQQEMERQRQLYLQRQNDLERQRQDNVRRRQEEDRQRFRLRYTPPASSAPRPGLLSPAEAEQRRHEGVMNAIRLIN